MEKALETRINISKGETFFHKGATINKIYMIVKGTACARYSEFDIKLEAGTIAGIMDLQAGHYLFDYVAESDVTVLVFTVRDVLDINNLFHMGKNYQELAVTSLLYQIGELVGIYEDHFQSVIRANRTLKPKSQITIKPDLLQWDYLREIKGLAKPLFHQLFTESEMIAFQHVNMGSSLADQIFECMEQMQEAYGEDIFSEQRKRELAEKEAAEKAKVEKEQAEKAAREKAEKEKAEKEAAEKEKAESQKKARMMQKEVSDQNSFAVDPSQKILDIMNANASKVSMLVQQLSQDNGDIQTEQTQQIQQTASKAEEPNSVQDTDTKEKQSDTVEETVTPEQALEEMSHAMEKILAYSETEPAKCRQFQDWYYEYMQLPDRLSSDNEVRVLRKDISNAFYDIYEKVFLKVVKEKKPARLMEMFLTFGFMDENEFSKEQQLEMYELKPDYKDAKYAIFTIYDWLKAIYHGEREPSKNDMDVNYKENLRELKKRRQYTLEEENSYLSDQENKVRFEIHNIVRTTSRLTSGAITVFCPILDSRQMAQSAKQMVVTADRIANALDKLIDVDYSIFYREQMYYDADNRIDNILVMKQVKPDFILMPTVGSRGIMWQEISEKKRDTPARFVMAQFVIGNLDDIMLSMVGAFRWEMCRTIQGNYWNDIRDHSLTSEYCDYVQFYRKNKDLSDEVKDKIYAQFKSCRNNYKEMFIKDYESWVKYESKGSLRVNKAVRKILFMYCPFSAKYREMIQRQPVFEDASSRFVRERQKKVRELKSFNSNVLKRGGTITDVLAENLEFYESM